MGTKILSLLWSIQRRCADLGCIFLYVFKLKNVTSQQKQPCRLNDHALSAKVVKRPLINLWSHENNVSKLVNDMLLGFGTNAKVQIQLVRQVAGHAGKSIPYTCAVVLLLLERLKITTTLQTLRIPYRFYYSSVQNTITVWYFLVIVQRAVNL